MIPYKLIAAGVAVLSAYAWGRIDGGNIEEAKHLSNEAIVREARDAMIQASAEKIAQIKVINRTNETRLEREIVRVPDFSKCDFGPDVKRVLDDALAGKVTESSDNGELSGTDPAG